MAVRVPVRGSGFGVRSAGDDDVNRMGVREWMPERGGRPCARAGGRRRSIVVESMSRSEVFEKRRRNKKNGLVVPPRARRRSRRSGGVRKRGVKESFRGKRTSLLWNCNVYPLLNAIVTRSTAKWMCRREKHPVLGVSGDWFRRRSQFAEGGEGSPRGQKRRFDRRSRHGALIVPCSRNNFGCPKSLRNSQLKKALSMFSRSSRPGGNGAGTRNNTIIWNVSGAER